MEKHWQVNGRHYAKTAQAWLKNLDHNRGAIMPVLQDVYGLMAVLLLAYIIRLLMRIP